MAREKKQREPIITEPVFNSYQAAKDARDKAQQKVNRIKIGLIIAAVAEILLVLWNFIPETSSFLKTLSNIVIIGAVVCAAASYIVGGGFLIALSTAWKIAKTIGWIGWVLVPFPADIFTGILLTMFALAFFPFSLLFLPLIFVGVNYKQNKVNLNVAEQYLQHCQP